MTDSDLMQAVIEYLETRRAMGYQLRVEETLLRSFVRFAAARGHRGPLTRILAEDWARESRRDDPYTWARRIAVLRPFARHLAATEPQTEIPPLRLFGPAHRRLPPRILTPAEVTQLLHSAAHLTPDSGLRALTMATLVGLLACTGLRVSEALRLQDADVDLHQGLLRIRQSKFRKSRLVPLHRSAIDALARYSRQRDRLAPVDPKQAFFQLAKGVPLTYSRTRTAFGRLRQQLGWNRATGQARPELRSLRHTFACRRLAAWYEQGVDVSTRVHALSTYLGHGKVSDTYWYLSGIPELLAIAGKRFRSPADSEGSGPCRR